MNRKTFKFGSAFRHVTRWFMVLLLACAVSGGAIGFPTLRHVAKDHSQPFPCQDRSCGCMTADSCWHSCCCHTNAEKIAWAEEHGVTPPAYVFAAAAAEAPDEAPRSCCQKNLAGDEMPCDDSDEPVAAQTPEATTPETQASHFEFKLVQIDAFRKCQGLAQLWNILSEAMPAVWPAPLVEPALVEVLAPFSQSYGGYSQPPASPPPRLA